MKQFFRVNMMYTGDGQCSAMLQTIDYLDIATNTVHWKDVRSLEVLHNPDGSVSVVLSKSEERSLIDEQQAEETPQTE